MISFKHPCVYSPNSLLNTKNKEVKEKTTKDYKCSEKFIANLTKENENFKTPMLNLGKVCYFLNHHDLKCLKF